MKYNNNNNNNNNSGPLDNYTSTVDNKMPMNEGRYVQ